MRTLPPTLLTLTRRALIADKLLAPSAREAAHTSLLVAVSGGPDSMALRHVLSRLQKTLGFRLHAHGVDHGLRTEAARELDQAAAFAKKLEVPFERTVVKVAAGGNLQARARAARWKALRAARERAEASLIATGHHAEDRAEPVLLRLLRGASPSGLAVLPARARDVIRPFLRARRQDIVAHLGRHDVPYSDDPSNLDPRFLRTRVRHELLPLLTSLSPGVVSHLNGLADDLLAQRDDPHSYDGTYVAPLPRATRLALAALAASRSITGRVALAHGLVVTFARSPAQRPGPARLARGGGDLG